MFVKQISRDEALRLFSKEQEIMIMVPAFKGGNGWEDYMPDTLQNFLDGCLFFRQEPAMVAWDGLGEGRVVSSENQPEETTALVEQLRTLPEAPKNQEPDVRIPAKRTGQ